jgi:DnaK suppressor protein
MDAQSISKLKDRLEAEGERLEAEIHDLDANQRDSLSEASGENVYRDHMADQGSATFERELDMTLEESVRDAYRAVRAALKRVEEGTYGVCERCSTTIPVERLEAVPTATMCIACKEADETR